MRWPVFLAERVTDRATRAAAVLSRALGVPVHWPRITTRLLMLVVALIAIALWAALELPQTIDQAEFRRLHAQAQAELEQQFRNAEQEQLGQARAVEAERDDWRQRSVLPDELTEHYFAARREIHIVDAGYRRDMAGYHARLASKYGVAKWFPFASISPDPAPPSDPLTPPSPPFEPGKRYEATGGKSVVFAPAGDRLAVGCWEHAIRFVELPSRKELANLAFPDLEPTFLACSRDATALYSLGHSHLVWRWNMAPGSRARAIPWIDRLRDQPGELQFPTALACSPDGRTIAIAARGYQRSPSPALQSIYGVRLISTETGDPLWEHKGTGDSPLSVAFAPDGETLAFGIGTVVHVLDTGTAKLKKMLTPATGTVLGVAFSPDGSILAGAGSDVVDSRSLLGKGRVMLWDVSSGIILRRLDGPNGRAQTVAFSPDGRTLAGGGTGRTKNGWDRYAGRRSTARVSEVRLWDVATGKTIWTAEGEAGTASSLAFSADGSLVAFCDGSYVYVVRAYTGKLEQVMMETNWRGIERTLPERTKRRGES
jgi:hypothetical protein